jgi:hypothetical protein
MKMVGMVRKVKLREIDKVGWLFTFTGAAYNLCRFETWRRKHDDGFRFEPAERIDKRLLRNAVITLKFRTEVSQNSILQRAARFHISS